MDALRAYIESLRPTQWIKNFFVFAGIIFSKNITNEVLALKALVAFFAFSFVASSMYIINDMIDLENDRKHPEKRNRPLARGAISLNQAGTIAVIIGTLGLLGGLFINRSLLIILSMYLILFIFYSMKLKTIVIIDVLIIAIGFILRVLAGTIALGINASPWVILCSFSLALFFGFCKRRHEVVLLQKKGVEHRSVLAHYSVSFLDSMIIITSVISLLFYTLYTVSPMTIQKFNTEHLIYTVPFVLYGIFRYLYLIHIREEGGNPSKLIVKDSGLIATFVLWLGSAISIIYFSN